MPTYAYVCRYCGWESYEFYKSLPEDPNAPIDCRSCSKRADRNFVKDAGASVFLGNSSSSSGLQDLTGLSHGNKSGKAYFTDNNGNKQEVRTVRDVDRWTKDNQLGKPRLRQVRDPETGKMSWEPMKTKAGVIIRESERLIPLGKENPRLSKTRYGLDGSGAARQKMIVDPETKRKVPVSSLWTDKDTL